MVEIACAAARDAWTELAATTAGREAEEMVIHRAILAERKRCAGVAMKEARDFAEHRMVEVSYGATCAAKAIMNGGS